MGRKGAGRKAFVKSAMAHQSTDDEPETPAAAVGSLPEVAAPDPPKPAVEDKSVAFLKAPADSVKAETMGTAETAKSVEKEATGTAASTTQPEAANGAASEETRGQLVQRHKRELKAHKEHTKKLGKKRKDEVEELDKAIEARHAAELAAWDAANQSADDADTTLVAPTSGLYDLKLGADEKQTKKPTKAQKRREQRAADEAEREARIAGEQAGLGESERQQEADALRDLLRPLGLAVRDIPADGHCMYRAVQDQLEAGDGKAVVPGYAQLREETASYMRAFPDEFVPFVVQEDDDEDSETDTAARFEAYCREVEETAAWGGQIELQALAQALERHILVHSVGLPILELGTEYKGKQSPLQVCYLRHAFALGEHYNSVTPLEA